LKSETRRSKAEGNPKPEIRKILLEEIFRIYKRRPIRASDFGLLSDFGLRDSAFITA
jgi:hypothetical protein